MRYVLDIKKCKFIGKGHEGRVYLTPEGFALKIFYKSKNANDEVEILEKVRKKYGDSLSPALAKQLFGKGGDAMNSTLLAFAAPLAILFVAASALAGQAPDPAAVIPALFLTLAAATTFYTGVIKIVLPLELGERARVNIGAFLAVPELGGTRHDFRPERNPMQLC